MLKRLFQLFISSGFIKYKVSQCHCICVSVCGNCQSEMFLSHRGSNLDFFLQTDVYVHCDWVKHWECGSVYSRSKLKQKRTCTSPTVLKSNGTLGPGNLFHIHKKLLSVCPESGPSSGTHEYFIANTIFCCIEALIRRNRWKRELQTKTRLNDGFFSPQTSEWL